MPIIEEIKVTQFADDIFHESQQRESRLMNTVMNKMVRGEQATWNRLEQSGDMDELTERHGDTDNEEPDYIVRIAVMRFFKKSHWTDKPDELETLIADLSSKLMKNLTMTAGRNIDDIIIEAAVGVALEGKSGSSLIPLPPAQIIPAAATAMTKLKILEAKKRFDEQEVSEVGRTFVYNSHAIKELLQDPTLTSIDFRTVKAIEEGDLGSFLGFNFIRSERLPFVTAGSIRSNIAYQEDGIGLGFVETPFARIDERPDKNYLTQVYYRHGLGGVRVEDKRVLVIEADES